MNIMIKIEEHLRSIQERHF